MLVTLWTKDGGAAIFPRVGKSQAGRFGPPDGLYREFPGK